MKNRAWAICAMTVAAVAAAGCSSMKSSGSAPAPAPAAAPATADTKTPAPSRPGGKVVKSMDGTYTGEIYGTPSASSKFARLQIGMHPKDVQKIVGRSPDDMHTYESGKRWIPFYFGNDARRAQHLYKGEGCLIYAAGNAWGGASDGDLIEIDVDPSGACYQE